GGGAHGALGAEGGQAGASPAAPLGGSTLGSRASSVTRIRRWRSRSPVRRLGASNQPGGRGPGGLPREAQRAPGKRARRQWLGAGDRALRPWPAVVAPFGVCEPA